MSSNCKCKNVEFGSYDNQVLLGYYPIMRPYMRKRLENDRFCLFGICIDRCIVNQVIELWENDIRTYGSCCGHNKIQGFINVHQDDYEKALKLGFEYYEFSDPTRKDTVKTKDILNEF